MLGEAERTSYRKRPAVFSSSWWFPHSFVKGTTGFGSTWCLAWLLLLSILQKRLRHFVFLAWWMIGAGFVKIETEFPAFSPFFLWRVFHKALVLLSLLRWVGEESCGFPAILPFLWNCQWFSSRGMFVWFVLQELWSFSSFQGSSWR